jgi:hypothetical protein
MMDARLDVTTVALFMLVVFPGLISINVYRLVMPARPLDWTNALLQGLFYSGTNFVLGLPILYLLVFGANPVEHPARYFIAAVLVLLVTPVLWPVLVVAALRSKRFLRRVQVAYPTAWDFFFDSHEPVFVLVHLNNGALLAGYCGAASYAGSSPSDGDIYLEAVYRTTSSGGIGEPMPNSRGVLLYRSQYSYVELIAVPPDVEVKHAPEG